MAAVKTGFTRKLWWGFRVEAYAVLNDVESSSVGVLMFSRNPCAVKSRPLRQSQQTDRWRSKRAWAYRTSQSSPSVAVCFFVFNSLMTRDCNVPDSAGAAS